MTVPYMPPVELAPQEANGKPSGGGQHLPNEEKQRRHNKVVRFFDEGGYEGMEIRQVADALGVSTDSVRAEARIRGAYQPRGPLTGPGRGRKVAPSRLPHGEAERRMDEFFAKYPGGMFTVAEIAELTGLKVATIRTVFAQRGMATERPADLPRNQYGKYRIPGENTAQAELKLTPGEVHQLEAALDAGDPPAGHGPVPSADYETQGITYVGRNSEGRLIASVKGTDILWTLKLDSPL